MAHLQWEIHHGGAQTITDPVLSSARSIPCRDALIKAEKTVPRVGPDGPLMRWNGLRFMAHPVTGKAIPDSTAMVPVVDLEGVTVAPCPRADLIVGNPPFISNKRMRDALGDATVKAIRKTYPDLPDTFDFVINPHLPQKWHLRLENVGTKWHIGASRTPARSAMLQPIDCTPSELTNGALEDEIATLAAHLAAAEYRFLCLIAELDRRRVWATHGLGSAAHWLAWRCGVGLNAAREKVRVALALEHVPKIAAVFAEGRLSFSKVRALTRIAAPHNEDWLLNLALTGTAVHVEKVVRLARRYTEEEAIEAAEKAEKQRRVSWRWDPDGSLVIEGRLPAELGAMVVKALEAATEPPPKPSVDAENVTAVTPPEGQTLVQRRADALVAVAESFLASGYREGLAGERNQVQVVVQVGAQVGAGCGCGEAHFEGGPPIAMATARRFACDASVVTITEDSDGNVLDVGRRTRSIPPPIARALRRRDGGCLFPGCKCERYVDGHHVIHWADGGPTKLDNLVLLCRHHHGLVHEGGFTVDSDGAGGWHFARPDGTTLPTLFAAQAIVPGDLFASQKRLELSPQSLRPRWRGERMDDSMAVGALQTLARRARLAA